MFGKLALAVTVAGSFLAVWRSQRTPRFKVKRSLVKTSPM